jgi:RHS repeat-associated protein
MTEVLVCVVVVVVADPLWLTKSAFGELLSHTGSDLQPYAFAGEPLDPNSGFQYHRARWMDPTVGRFLGMDPFEGREYDPASLHKYLYAHSDPLNGVDPTGRSFLQNLGAAMTFMVTIAAIHLPRLTTVVYAVAEALSPVELGISPGQIGVGQLRKAAKTGGWQALRQLANVWRVWRQRGGTRGTGIAFEKFIGQFLRPGARPQVGIDAGAETGKRAGAAVLDWVDDASAAVIEAKNTFSTVKYGQAVEIGHYAAETGRSVHYVFLKKPTQQQLDALAGWIAEGAERSSNRAVEIAFSFLEP